MSSAILVEHSLIFYTFNKIKKYSWPAADEVGVTGAELASRDGSYDCGERRAEGRVTFFLCDGAWGGAFFFLV